MNLIFREFIGVFMMQIAKHAFEVIDGVLHHYIDGQKVATVPEASFPAYIGSVPEARNYFKQAGQYALVGEADKLVTQQFGAEYMATGGDSPALAASIKKRTAARARA